MLIYEFICIEMELRRQDFIRKLRKHNQKHDYNHEELKGGDVYSNSMILKVMSSDGKEWNEVMSEHRKTFEKAWEKRKQSTPCPEYIDSWVYEASEFMKILAFKIASQTSLKYDIKRIYRPELIIPLDILKDEDKTSTEELVKQKVNTLKTFLETEIDLSRCDQREKHKLSMINFEGYKLEIHTKFGITPVKLRKQNIKKIEVKSVQINNSKFTSTSLNSISADELLLKGGDIWDNDEAETNETNEEAYEDKANKGTYEDEANTYEGIDEANEDEVNTYEGIDEANTYEEDYEEIDVDETSSSIKSIDEIDDANAEDINNEIMHEDMYIEGGKANSTKDKPKPMKNKSKDKAKPKPNSSSANKTSKSILKAKALSLKTSDEVVEIQAPYIRDGAIVIDFSRPFEDMGFMFNGLHIFEHLMCTPWVHMKKFSMENLVCLNGFTTNLGLMYVYTVHNSKASFQVYLDEMISWLNKIRTPGFWHEHMKDEEIQMEIKRTISETIDIPWMVDFARSSGSAFEGNYREEVFEYWANQPLKITLIHPYQDIFIPNLDKPRPVQKPSIPTFDYLPMQALTVDSFTTYKKESTKEIAEQVYDALTYGLILKGDSGVDIQRLTGDGAYFEISLLSTYRNYIKNFGDMLKLIMLFESSTLGLFDPIYPDDWL